MKSNLKATIITIGMGMMLMAMVTLVLDVLTAEDVKVVSDQFLPESQIAAQP